MTAFNFGKNETLMNRKAKYPPIEPFRTGFLDVGDGHTLYYEECGNPKGKKAIFVHGGPGAPCEASHRSYFDPATYHIVLFHQRGCGKSTPFASLENNTTWHLVNDIEKLREHLKIDRWLVFGGSWGSTLSLSYAIKHPERVTELVVRGIFLCRPKDLHWFYQEGASAVFPDSWEDYLKAIPTAEQSDLIAAFHKRLNSPDKSIQIAAAKAWSRWEGATILLFPSEELKAAWSVDDFALAVARIENHYFLNKGFFPTDNWILENIHKIREAKIPGVIVHGRYDMCTPLYQGWELHKSWPEARFEIVPDAGHAASEGGIVDALIRATDSFRPA